MEDINPTLQINILSVNGLNTPTKGKLSKWINKMELHLCCLQETTLNIKTRLKVKG